MDDVPVERVTAKLIDALERAAVDYVIVGSLATNFYGVSRSTQGADIVVSCERDGVSNLVRELGTDFARRRKVTMYGRNAYILTVEDVIITKTHWLHIAGRAKDESDIRGVLQLHHARIDWPCIETWCDCHGTRELLERLRRECEMP